MDVAASGYHKHLDSINAELVDVNHRLERLYDALETSKLELSDLTPRIQVLRQRQDQLQSAKEELEDKFADRKVDLFYTIPLPHDGTVHDRAEVPSIVQLGSAYRIRTNDLRVMNSMS